MSDSNRDTGCSFDLTMLVGTALTVIALCVFLFFLGVKYGADNQRPQQQAAGGTSKANENAKLACFNSVASLDKINCLEKQIKAEHESQRAYDDLAAQQQMADWALLIVIISGVQAILSLGGVYLLVRNLNLAREATSATVEANNVAREIGEAQVRAYLACTSAYFTISESGVWCYATITNSGQSPAITSLLKLRLLIKKSTDPDAPSANNPDIIIADYESTNYAVIPAGQSEKRAVVWRPHTFDEGTLAGLRSGELTFVARGKSEWVDVFRKKQILPTSLIPATDPAKIQNLTNPDGSPWMKGDMLVLTMGPIQNG